MREATKNPMLKAWAEGRQLFGAWATIPSGVSAELMAREGPDFICIDNQHGLLDHSDTVPMIIAVEAGGAIPIVRAPWNEPARIMAPLDAGARGVVIPMVNDADEAQRAVAACRYPPRGMRSYGPLRAKYVMGTTDPDELDDVACIVMVETADGLKNLDDIASTVGVDAIYIGPQDLSLAVGKKPSPKPYETLAEPLALIKAACRRHGIAVGIHALNGETARVYAEDGYDMITVVSDLSILARAVSENVAMAREGVGKRG